MVVLSHWWVREYELSLRIISLNWIPEGLAS